MPNYAERITEEANALAGAVRLANATTGAEDTGIVDAVATLIAGYGGGGGDIPAGMKLQVIEYPTTDAINNPWHIPHSLGVEPDIVVCILRGSAEFPAGGEYILYSMNVRNKITGYRNLAQLSTTNGSNLLNRYELSNYPGGYTASEFKTPAYSSDHKLAANASYLFVVAAY